MPKSHAKSFHMAGVPLSVKESGTGKEITAYLRAATLRGGGGRGWRLIWRLTRRPTWASAALETPRTEAAGATPTGEQLAQVEIGAFLVDTLLKLRRLV